MAERGEVLRASWLSSTRRVILVAVIDNCERYRVECDEEDIDRVGEVMSMDVRMMLANERTAKRLQRSPYSPYYTRQRKTKPRQPTLRLVPSASV